MHAEWFWTDRWLGSSARGLPLEPRGLYREMLTVAWRQHAQLPAEPDAIRRLVGCSIEEWDRCWPLVQPYWRNADGVLVNDTQLEVYAECLRKAVVASVRARAGGRAKARKTRRARSTLQAVLKQEPSTT